MAITGNIDNPSHLENPVYDLPFTLATYNTCVYYSKPGGIWTTSGYALFLEHGLVVVSDSPFDVYIEYEQGGSTVKEKWGSSSNYPMTQSDIPELKCDVYTYMSTYPYLAITGQYYSGPEGNKIIRDLARICYGEYGEVKATQTIPVEWTSGTCGTYEASFDIDVILN